MTWPVTAVLDPLNRTENPLVGPGGSGWGAGYVTNNDGTGTFEDDGTTAISTADGTWATAPWTKTDYSGDVECYATLPTFATAATACLLYARITNPGGTSVLGYGAYFQTGGLTAGSQQCIIESLDASNTENIQVTVSTLTFHDGDQLGIGVVGSINPVVTAYQNGTPIATWTDSRGTPYTHGYIGMGTVKGVAGQGFSNFGGGNPFAATIQLLENEDGAHLILLENGQPLRLEQSL